ENVQPVPIGVPGELWIGGAGVARGYHKRPELTAERFAEDPFCSGDRIYRTGDLVQYRSDGVLEFLGRTDSQVKLRGFRVELGEIEVALGKHPDVHEAAVLVREDSPGNHRLVGYCTPQNGRVPSREELRAFLSESLPDYMVPTDFVALDAFPMTPNRKLDRKALPEPRQSQTVIPLPTNGEPVTHTVIEKQLLAVWEDVLGVHDMHPESNFFDLGGHSLLAMQVQVRLREAHGHDVRIVDLFRFPTVRALAEHLNESGEEERSDTVNEGADRGARRAALLRRRARPTS
ncbi:MAG: non-ribosomal peptide synthetase, partial [Bacteroidetes bacterium]|nr:non-ribosomal peptide synthetase [Bacteroidota bacterium]